MASKRVRVQDKVPDEEERARIAVRRAIGPLVRLLGHESDQVVLGAAEALCRLGASLVVGPLADALPRAKVARQRGLIVSLLRDFGGEEKFRVLRALHAARKRETNLEVAAIIQKALVNVTFGRGAPQT